MQRDKLTPRQAQVLEIIQQSIARDGYPPTIREIGNELGIRSTNGVNDHLKALERKGYLTREESKSRSVVPVDHVALEGDMVEVPVLGRIAAGQPILAVENTEDTVKVDRFFLGRSAEVFALRVVGDSMIGDGIHDGDFIFVQKQNHAPRGEIVVAWIEGEATVKRYFPEGDRIRFQPSNPDMEPIYVHRDEFRETQILGVVAGLYRTMH
ncbi:MAG: transcriptional repressor LexA [Myxococcota bacterium]